MKDASSEYSRMSRDLTREILKRLDALAPEEVCRMAISILLVSEDEIVWKIAAAELDDQQRAKLLASLLPTELQQRLADALLASASPPDGVTH